jgi:hypothetical protein
LAQGGFRRRPGLFGQRRSNPVHGTREIAKQVTKGTIGQISADRGYHQAFIGLQHAGWIDDFEHPFPLQQLQRLDYASLYSDAVKEA